jgi:hypothetical protein
MTIDWNISLGNILTIATMIMGIVLFVLRNVGDTRVKEAQAVTLREDVILIKADLKSLNKIVTEIAVQNSRLDNQGERMNSYDKRVDSLEERMLFLQRDYNLLRSGRGWIQSDIDGEYERDRKVAG